MSIPALDDLARFIAVQIRRLASHGQKTTDAVSVQQRTVEIHFRPRAESRITVLSDQPGNVVRQAALLQLVQRVSKHLRAFGELLRPAVIRERIPLERKEGELVELAVVLQIPEEATHPSGFAEFNSTADLRLLDVLEARPSQLKRGIDFVNRFFKLKVQSSEVLRIHKLPIGFFADFNSLDRITASR